MTDAGNGRNILEAQRLLGFSFCLPTKAEAWRGGWGFGGLVTGDWQQQAINQLTVQKNCRKLLDIYGQRTYIKPKSRVWGSVRTTAVLICHAHCRIAVTNATSPFFFCSILASMTLKDGHIVVGHNYTCFSFECVSVPHIVLVISACATVAQWSKNCKNIKTQHLKRNNLR